MGKGKGKGKGGKGSSKGKGKGKGGGKGRKGSSKGGGKGRKGGQAGAATAADKPPRQRAEPTSALDELEGAAASRVWASRGPGMNVDDFMESGFDAAIDALSDHESQEVLRPGRPGGESLGAGEYG